MSQIHFFSFLNFAIFRAFKKGRRKHGVRISAEAPGRSRGRRLGEDDLHGEGAAGDVEDGHPAEEVGELLRVHGRARDHELEVHAPTQHLSRISPLRGQSYLW